MFSDEITFCLCGKHTQTYMYARSFPGEECKPQCMNQMVKHLLKDHDLVRSEIGHRRWNRACDQVHLHTAEVCGATSTAAIPRFCCLKDESETCRAKLVTNWMCQNNTTPQSLDLNSIENLYRKVHACNLGDNQAHAD